MINLIYRYFWHGTHMAEIRADGVLGWSWILTIASYSSLLPYLTAYSQVWACSGAYNNTILELTIRKVTRSRSGGILESSPVLRYSLNRNLSSLITLKSIKKRISASETFRGERWKHTPLILGRGGDAYCESTKLIDIRGFIFWVLISQSVN